MKSNKKIICMMIALGLLALIGVVTFWEAGEAKAENLVAEKETVDSNKLNLEMELIAYSHAELNFVRITADELNVKIDEENPFFLYTGRATCQWCRKMVPILSKVIKEINIEMFYLDSENTETDESLSDFREKYGIKTVPSIIYFKGPEDYYAFVLSVAEDDMDEIEKNLKDQFEIAISEN